MYIYFFWLDSAIEGMWVTLVNECSNKKLQSCFETSLKIQEKVIRAITKTQVKTYEESQDNIVRSLTNHGNGRISKDKYKSVCRNIVISMKSNPSWQSGSGIFNPKLVYYDKLIAFVKLLDIDNIHDFSSKFCQLGLEAFEDPISGSYKDFCSYILVLAEMYNLEHNI